MMRQTARARCAALRCAIALAMVLTAAHFAFAGTDVFVCNVGALTPASGFANYGLSAGYRAYAIQTFACNKGDIAAHWIETTNQHPIIAQNMFRLKNGKLEQIGQAWVKHGFFAETDSGCTTCQPPPNPDGTMLGVGCCDTYSAFLNGFQDIMGPKSEINPSTGVFPYPFCGGTGCAPYDLTTGRRIRVADADLDTDPAVLYFMEAQYITADDCAASPRTDYDNASYRRVSINASKQLVSWVGGSLPGDPGIKAWGANDVGVTTQSVDVLGDGRFFIAAKATDLGAGMWHYEYAVQNLNSDRAATSFTVPLAPGATVTNVSFHGVPYHSGEPYDNTDWDLPAAGVCGPSLTWATHPFPADPPNANALRWGTMYNFGFDVNLPPASAPVALGLFKAGSPNAVSLSITTPKLCNCAGDTNGDTRIDGADVPSFVAAYLGSSPNYCADLAAPIGPLADDTDLSQFVTDLLSGTACP